MSTWHLVLREIGYRKGNFLWSMLAVGVAAACVATALSLVGRYDLRTEQLAAQQQADLKQKMAALEDDYRKIMLGLGFNVLILPKDQKLDDFYADDYATKLMPEAYAKRLIDARVISINHVLPILQQKIEWPEQRRTVQLIGTRGEVGLSSKGRRAALREPVPPGHVAVGYELHRSLGLAVGDRIVVRGQPLVVSALQPQRGNQEDITLWIYLAEAQKMLGKEHEINVIQALECTCTADRLGEIRGEIAKILPDTQVIEFSSQALARAEARGRAAVEAQEAVERQERDRAAQARQRQRLFALLLPAVLGACGLWVGLLALGNARSRGGEIGILRALGVPGGRILTLLLARAALVGLAGAALGFAAGWLGSWFGEQYGSGGPGLGPRFDPLLLVLLVVLTPFFSALAAWLPARWASGRDPAEIIKTPSAA
ncbi:MAG: FtsX-like permease family protein [Thermoguttaceae bacterium]|jgi:cell division protein FtsX